MQQWRLRSSRCGSHRESRAMRQHDQSCGVSGRAILCACHMLHVKAGFALVREMVADLA